MHMDPSTGMVTEIVHNDARRRSFYNEWVEIRTLIDLDSNYMEAYYNGTMVASGAWNIRTGGLISLQNVSLYAPHIETVYYNNLSLVPTPGTLAALGLVVCAASPLADEPERGYPRPGPRPGRVSCAAGSLVARAGRTRTAGRGRGKHEVEQPERRRHHHGRLRRQAHARSPEAARAARPAPTPAPAP